MRVAVFISGGGSNLQSLIDAKQENYFKSEIVLVVSNKESAFGLERAKKANIATLVSTDNQEIETKLAECNVDLIVLAGYLRIVPKSLIDKYMTINIHPSLLPKYGGKGMYGMNVHRAVFENGERESGATVHYVTEVIDGGAHIAYGTVDISACCSPEDVQKAVLVVEHKIYKEAIKLLENCPISPS